MAMVERDNVNDPVPGSVYRTLGPGSAWNRIGCGVLDKAGRRQDTRDYDAPTWSLVWVLRGRGEYRDRQGATALSPGWCFQRQPGRRHSTELDPDSRWLECWIDLGPALHRSLVAAGILPSEPTAWRAPSPLASLLALRTELAAADDRDLPGFFPRIAALATDAFAHARAAGGEDAIARASRLLADESVRRVDLRAWCQGQGLAYEAFRKAFTARVGEPPGRYRIRRRLEMACQLLEAGLPVAVVAERLGYASPYEFSAQFRARLGVPPSRYRSG